MIADNLKMVHEKIEAACKRSGRNPSEVTLLCVSKTKPLELIEECIKAGETSFGENYVQELCDKIQEEDNKDLNWHMIGHLQRNKVKYILGKTTLIHAVDSLRLAEQIEKECVKKGLEADILLEVNVAREESKFGFTVDNLLENLLEIAKFPHVHIKGLMTSAPYVTNPEENRKYFAQLKQISVDIEGKNIDKVIMSVLSMGMTNDYEIAVEEGATVVRVGTAIFGARNYDLEDRNGR